MHATNLNRGRQHGKSCSTSSRDMDTDTILHKISSLTPQACLPEKYWHCCASLILSRTKSRVFSEYHYDFVLANHALACKFRSCMEQTNARRTSQRITKSLIKPLLFGGDGPTSNLFFCLLVHAQPIRFSADVTGENIDTQNPYRINPLAEADLTE